MQSGSTIKTPTRSQEQQPIIVIPETPKVIVLPSNETPYPFLLSGLAIVVSLYTFYHSLRRQLNEHRAAFFHNVVVDHCLKDIIAFHKKIYDLAVSELPRLKKDRDVKDVQEVMRKINSETRTISLQVAGLVRPFDAALENRSNQAFDDISDSSTRWLEAEIEDETSRGLPELSRILATSQTRVITLLREGEFQQGWPSPRVRFQRLLSKR
jgi:hypothetical protein